MKHFFYISILLILVTETTINAQICTPTNVAPYNKCCTMGINKMLVGNTTLFDSTSYSTTRIYTDGYDSNATSMVAGSKYTFYLKASVTNNTSVCMWTDWNKNDTFEFNEIIYYRTVLTANKIDTISFTPMICGDSFRIRVLADYYFYYTGGKTTFDPCKVYYGDFYDFKLYTTASSNLDISASGFATSSVLSVGNHDLKLKLRNNSNSAIDSARVYYQINGGSIVQENITGLSLASCAEYTHTFATQFSVGNGMYTIKAWVKYPNGTDPDANVINDTISMQVCAALGGNYTINGTQATAGTNFKNFSDAVSALNTCGISSPVVFNVAAGTYVDSVSLNTINGSSSTNTVTFDGVDTATRIMQAYATSVFILTDVTNIQFKHLTFKIGNGGTGLDFRGECSKALVDSCNFRTTPTATLSTAYGIYFRAAAKAGVTGRPTYMTITNCVFKDVGYGLYMNASNANRAFGNKVTRNKFYTYRVGAYIYYQDSALIIENSFYSGINYRIYAFYGSYNTYTRNEFHGNAATLVYMNQQTTSWFVNNILSSDSNTINTMQLFNSSDLYIYHNTCFNTRYAGNACYVSNSTNMDMRNNIFSMNGGNAYALYALTANQFAYLDFNQYHNGKSSSKFVYMGSDYASFAALKGQFGFNLNSSNTTPPFVNTGSIPRNLHLAAAPPAYGDYTVGVTVDYDNESRCSIAPTVGADESKYNTGLPVSNFSVSDTAYLNSPILFTNSGSFMQGKYFDWYVDASSSPDYTSQDTWHTYTSLGSHTMKLTTTNCIGSHDATKTIQVVNPTKVPVVFFRADVVDIEVNEEVQFTDSSLIGPTSWLWTITGGLGIGVGVDYDYIIGDSMSQHPKVLFYISGLYEVCLTATNSIGSTQVCKKAYIKVNISVSMCNGTTSVADIFGHFYDEGGKTANYPSKVTTCDLLISPCSGPVTLTFTKMNYDSVRCSLKVYDGFDITGKLLSPKAIKAGNSFTAQSGDMFILWKSLAGSTLSGWEANWNTQYKYVPKAPASINTPDTGYSYGIQTYEVKYYKTGVTYDWDYNNDGTIDFQGRTADYTFGAAGNYTCVCYATSCGGIDTVTKDVLVLDPTTPPEPVQFVVDVTSGSACKIKPQALWAIEKDLSVMLLDKSGKAPTAWEWEVVGTSAANYSWDNGNSIQNPNITFYSLGTYTISLKVTNAAGSSLDTFLNIIKVVNPHCIPTVTATTNAYWGISEFSFKDIFQTSTTNTGYSSYAGAPITCVESGTKYGFSVKRGSITSDARAAIWIDYNQDGDFADAGEVVKSNVKLTTQFWTDSIKINKLASNVLWGYTIMRVGITDPTKQFLNCGTNATGEFEDYSIYIIDDLTAPVITLIGSDTLKTEQGLTYKDLGAIAFDALDGYIPIIPSTNLNTANLGYYWVKYDAKDKAGNYAYPVYRTVEVTVDKSAPVITLLGNNPYYQNVNTSFTDPWATAYDSVDGNINNITTSGTVNTAVLGNYSIWYYAQDSKGYKDSVMRTVIVQDITPPSLTLNGKDTIHLAVLVQYVDAGWSVNDNYDPNPTVTVSPAKIDSSVLQTTTTTYTAKDATGNTSTKTRVVIVEDLIAPVITLNGSSPFYHEVKTSYTEPGASVTDNFYTGITPVITGGPVNPNVLGTYTLTYTATDGSGNTSITNRDVIVRKTTKPIIYLNGQDTVYLFVNQTYGDPGVNSIGDAYYSSNLLMTLLQSSSTFANPATAPGTYYTWYIVADPSGNTDSATRTFLVNTNGIRSVNELSPIILWPNPTNDLLNVNGLSKGLNIITLYDAAGKQVLTETIKGENGSLYTTSLAIGIYILKSVNDGKIAIARFEIAR